jgi:hypothetical protein
MTFTSFIEKELSGLIIGEKIGHGSARTVYNHRHDKNLVIKIEEGGKSFSNALEWEIWRTAQGDGLEQWLAPCVDISPCGGILLMKRVLPVTLEEMPLQIPAQFTDLKIQNWGRYDGRIVCCDYGVVLFNTKGKLRKADWWSA